MHRCFKSIARFSFRHAQLACVLLLRWSPWACCCWACCLQPSLARAQSGATEAGAVQPVPQVPSSTPASSPAVADPLRSAQVGAACSGVATPGPVPPRVIEAARPRFPEAASAAGVEQANVLLRVTVDGQGQVIATEVVEPAGYGFEGAAAEAAFAHRFEPGCRDGQPISARVLLQIGFHAPESAPSTPASLAPAPPAPPRVTEPIQAAAPAPPVPDVAIEVQIVGDAAAERLRRSAAAVQVVETGDAKRRSADLGEVLARAPGVGVQRAGGLGSDMRFSLNGLTDDQVRFFLDGIPLEFAGYPLGIANVPVNLVERVEVYRGVLPIRFGADALGGAANVVTDVNLEPGAHAAASVQAGSFGTYRTTLSAHYLDKASGWLARASAFLDRAENDYPMDIVVAGPTGREEPARVYRFNDGYRAEGGSLQVGVRDRPWAKRLQVRGFATRFSRGVQHNLLMTFNPFGEVLLGGRTVGATARYEQVFARRLSLSVVSGYAHRTIAYTDLAHCYYGWFGQCLGEDPQPGEVVGRPQDQRYWEHNAYGRVHAEWQLNAAHSIRVAVSPTLIERAGDERREANPDARDPLSVQRQLFGVVAGAEYQVNLLDDWLENIAFVKGYFQGLRSEEPLSDGVSFRRRDRGTERPGLGDSLRLQLAPWAYAKASYEWATRLPRPDEVFGNAFPVRPNLELEPEVSHNLNLGVILPGVPTVIGELRGEIHGFLRDADRLITLVGDDQAASYQNVYRARSLGVEASAGWTSPGRYVALDGNFTYVDLRNASDEGPFARNEGERIPNRPYLFANGTARLQAHGVAAPRDELALIWTTRYVHPFFRAWEGIGVDKLKVPSQLLHSLALSYYVEGGATELSFTGEVQNLSDEKAYDFFGVLKPGRAFYFKATLSL